MEIDGQKLKVVIISAFIVWFIYTQRAFFRALLHNLLLCVQAVSTIFLGLAKIFTGQQSEVLSLALLCAMLVFIVGLVKVLRQR